MVVLAVIDFDVSAQNDVNRFNSFIAVARFARDWLTEWLNKFIRPRYTMWPIENYNYMNILKTLKLNLNYKYKTVFTHYTPIERERGWRTVNAVN